MRSQNKRIKGTLTPYEPIEVVEMIEISQSAKRLLKGAPYPYRYAANRTQSNFEGEDSMQSASTATIPAHELEHVALFAPPNCTGNSGQIGDTILQTSLVRSLLDQSLFPALREVHWWGAASVVERLFPHFKKHVKMHDWDGRAKNIPKGANLRHLAFDAGFICTRDDEACRALKKNRAVPAWYTTKPPLQAQSSTHLCRQLHTCLAPLGVHVAEVPEPQIIVAPDEICHAKEQLEPPNLLKASTNRVIGKHEFDPRIDKIFLLSPAVEDEEDERTWSRHSWKKLVGLLAAVGPVIIAYNPKKDSEKRAAEDMIPVHSSFRSCFAVPLGLRELAALAYVSTVSVARDSGPMHVAAAAVGPCGRPHVLGLMSIFSPDTWRPLSGSFEALGEWPLPLEQRLKPEEVAVRAAREELRAF